MTTCSGVSRGVRGAVARRLAVLAAGLLAVSGAPAMAQPWPDVDSAVVRHLRTPATPEVQLMGPALPFAPGRWFALAARSRAFDAARVEVRACTVDSAATLRVACVPLVLPRLDDNLFMLDSVRDRAQDDLDGDGVAELRFTVAYATVPEPAVGSGGYQRFFVFRAAPALRQILTFVVADGPAASAASYTGGTIEYADVNGDGRVDIVWNGYECESRDYDPGSEGCRDLRRIWLYRSRTRTWVTGARR